MSAFDDEMQRLRNILHQGYLERDPIVSTIRAVHVTAGELIPVLERELSEIKNLGFNVVNIHHFLPANAAYLDAVDGFLTLLNSYGLKAHFTLQTPPYGYRQDPLDSCTLAQLEDIINPIISRFAGNSTIFLWDVNSEIYVKPEHIAEYKMLIEYVKNNVSQQVSVALDDKTMIQELYDSLDLVNLHIYLLTSLRLDNPVLPWAVLDQGLNWVKSLGSKAIYIGEIGFCTWHVYPSNTGNSPYRLPDITVTTPKTEALQYDYLANMLHIIKQHHILGYDIWEWCDDVSNQSAEGGFGLKTAYPELRAKPALDLLSTTPKQLLFPRLSNLLNEAAWLLFPRLASYIYDIRYS